jgi:transcriptional repressor NrdR
MKCPFCEARETRVLDSRLQESGGAIRRRRECDACGRRFTSYERAEEQPLYVVKKDGRREAFDRSKILAGITKACEKRPVPRHQIEAIADDIEREVRERLTSEVPTRDIGEMVVQRLRALDPVAYVRFASVYREFRDAESFIAEVQRLTAETAEQKVED